MKLLLFGTFLACVASLAPAAAPAAASPANSVGSFLVTNNDVATGFGNTATFYSIAANGAVSDRTVVATGGVGVGGGSFASSRVAIVPQGQDVCVFASNAGTATIASISAATHTLIGNFAASETDTGTGNGIGLLANATHLYATYSSSSTIATFTIQSGCSLTFVNDVFTVGLNAGLVTGVAIHGSIMVATYGDGSVESFNISSGVPVSNGDAEISAGFASDHVPNGVDITADGHFAVFGDASTVTTLEVSDISSGKLTPTVAYDLGISWNSGNVRLSPDERLIFVTNDSGGGITAVVFDKTTGAISPGCTTGPLKGFYTNWSYAGAAALQVPVLEGGLVFVPEFGSNGFSSIGVVQLASTGSACTLTELAGSPIVDNADPSALLSIGIYPSRKF